MFKTGIIKVSVCDSEFAKKMKISKMTEFSRRINTGSIEVEIDEVVLQRFEELKTWNGSLKNLKEEEEK